MSRHHLHNFLDGRFSLFFLADDMQHGILERVAALINHHRLATTLKSRIERQHATPCNRRLQQQVAEIFGKHLDRVRLAVFRNFSTDLPFEARQYKPHKRIACAPLQKIRMGVIEGHKEVLGCNLHLIDRPFNPNLE